MGEDQDFRCAFRFLPIAYGLSPIAHPWSPIT